MVVIGLASWMQGQQSGCHRALPWLPHVLRPSDAGSSDSTYGVTVIVYRIGRNTPEVALLATSSTCVPTDIGVSRSATSSATNAIAPGCSSFPANFTWPFGMSIPASVLLMCWRLVDGESVANKTSPSSLTSDRISSVNSIADWARNPASVVSPELSPGN